MMSWDIWQTIGLTMLQLVTGDISGKYVYKLQPVKFAAIEARWHPEQPGRGVWFAVPDVKNKRNLFELGTPKLGSWCSLLLPHTTHRYRGAGVRRLLCFNMIREGP